MDINVRLPKGAVLIIEMLQWGGFDAYAVGGCIRDSLLGKTPSDWDITTSATPDQIIKLFKNAGFSVIPTGIEHGTITVLHKKTPYEITAYRVDGVYKDGRRPENVVFTTNLKKDLMRRDFTINAMAFNESDGLIDFFGGQEDLQNKIIRCVGDAGERFSEDYLRMLRAYRFSAVLNFKMDDSIEKSIIDNKNKILDISTERIRIEFEKTIVCDNFDGIDRFLDVFAEVLFPEAGDELELKIVKKVIRYTENGLLMRLCALFTKCNKQTVAVILKRLKFDNKTIGKVSDVLKYVSASVDNNSVSIKKILRDIGEESFLLLNRLQKSTAAAHNEPVCIYIEREKILNYIIQNNEPFRIKDLDISGSDIMQLTGKKPGEFIGKTLEFLLEKVIETPTLNKKELLLEIVLKRGYSEE